MNTPTTSVASPATPTEPTTEPTTKDLFYRGLEQKSIDSMVEAFCGTFNYQAQIRSESGELVDNPQSPLDFFTKKIMEYAGGVTERWIVRSQTAAFEAGLSAQVSAAIAAATAGVTAHVVDSVDSVDSDTSTGD